MNKLDIVLISESHVGLAIVIKSNIKHSLIAAYSTVFLQANTIIGRPVQPNN